MEDVIFLIFGSRSDLTENERFLRKLFKIRNDQHYNTKLFCSQKVFPKPTICLIKHKIESENQIFGSRLLNRNMTTSIIKPLLTFEFTSQSHRWSSLHSSFEFRPKKSTTKTLFNSTLNSISL